MRPPCEARRRSLPAPENNRLAPRLLQRTPFIVAHRRRLHRTRLAQRAVFTPLAYEAYLVLLRILGILAREEGAAVAARGGGGGGGAAAVPECSAAGDASGATLDAKCDAGAAPAGDALSAVP